jgi:hypothetical protein
MQTAYQPPAVAPGSDVEGDGDRPAARAAPYTKLVGGGGLHLGSGAVALRVERLAPEVGREANLPIFGDGQPSGADQKAPRVPQEDELVEEAQEQELEVGLFEGELAPLLLRHGLRRRDGGGQQRLGGGGEGLLEGLPETGLAPSPGELLTELLLIGHREKTA